MDGFLGQNWSAPASNPNNNTSKPPPMGAASAFSYQAFRTTPSPLGSGRNTPLSAQGSGNVGYKPPAAKPAQDAFSNLGNFGSAKGTANLSLRERQEQLDAEKRRKEEEKRNQTQASFGGIQLLGPFGQQPSGGMRTPSPAIPPATQNSLGRQNGRVDSDDDLFAAFNAATKVDNASHFPPPSLSTNPAQPAHPAQPTLISAVSTPPAADGLNLSNPGAWDKPTGGFGDDGDDFFGLSGPKAQVSVATAATTEGSFDDDLLDLGGGFGEPGRKVRQEPQPEPRRQAKAPTPEPGKPIEGSDSESEEEPQPRRTGNDPFDKAVAQLIDYGFSPEDARRGLTESGAGLNVQAAVNWLLDDAHRKAKEQASGNKSQAGRPRREHGESFGSLARSASPAWAREDEVPRRRDNRSPAAYGEGEFTKTAATLGNTFLKSANSLWKTSQKKVQKAVADFQQDGGDPNQPKWMRSAQQERVHGDLGKQKEPQHDDMTNEAMMLESGGRSGRRNAPEPREKSGSAISSRDQSPAMRPAAASWNQSVPKWQQPGQQPSPEPRARVSKQAIEEQSSQAYVSPARRKKTTPQPQPQKVDLLFTDTSEQLQARLPQRPSPQPSPAPVAKAVSKAPPPRPAPPARQIPALSAAALQASTRHRLEGTARFKQGDYAAAHSSYGESLSALPQNHPLAILLLCNRALTALKTGEPRQAVDDADAALALIGPAKGEGESVALVGEGEAARDMKDLYGKALTRKAEALEQMEKWSEAAVVWQTCVESGVGGHAAIAGRQRCQTALAPKPKPKPRVPTPVAAAARRPTPRPAASVGANGGGSKSSEAVQRLREANVAAARADDEKFALVDKVDARIAAWRDGKSDNIRSLLASLDQVLWEGSGWKKVGISELLAPARVKIVYMKAIAKCHPDKISQEATTEVRMIAGSVFSTLNESWDKFRGENGL